MHKSVRGWLEVRADLYMPIRTLTTWGNPLGAELSTVFPGTARLGGESAAAAEGLFLTQYGSPSKLSRCPAVVPSFAALEVVVSPPVAPNGCPKVVWLDHKSCRVTWGRWLPVALALAGVALPNVGSQRLPQPRWFPVAATVPCSPPLEAEADKESEGKQGRKGKHRHTKERGSR